MAEAKFEKPLSFYTVDNFINESRKLIGKEVHDIPATFESAKYDFISAYSRALGDDNPLYNDLEYAAATKYDTLIAPPTFLITFEYPICKGALLDGPYPLVGMEAE